MKICYCPRYGGPDVLEFREAERPEPKPDELLVRIAATTVASGDSRMRSGIFPPGMGLIARPFIGIRGPRRTVLGTELAGIVEQVGSAVTRFAPGDAVIAFPGGQMGCHAEYRCIAEDGPVALKPAALSLADAATLCFGGSTALHFLAAADVKQSDEVLVIGASGAVGSALVQLARHAGARVTAVCSGSNAELVRNLGADVVIDYTLGGYPAALERYDVIFETTGSMTFPQAPARLLPDGRFVAIAAGLPDMLATLRPRRPQGHRVIAGPATERPEYVAQIADLAERGVLKPVVDRYFAFADIRAAHALVDSGRKRGSVSVILDEAATA